MVNVRPTDLTVQMGIVNSLFEFFLSSVDCFLGAWSVCASYLLRQNEDSTGQTDGKIPSSLLTSRNV